MAERLSNVEFAKMLESHYQEDGSCILCGQAFTMPEITRAVDVYTYLNDYIFALPPEDQNEYMNDFLGEQDIMDNIGVKLVMSLVLDEASLGAFLLGEKDNRIVQLTRKRLQNLEYKLPWDSELEIA